MERKYLPFEKPLEAIEKELAHLQIRKQQNFEDTQTEIIRLQQKLAETTEQIFSSLTPFQKVQLARHPSRPHTLDYIKFIFEEFLELHGDRVFGDDPAVIAGLAKFEGTSVVVVGQQKGADTKENLQRKFGMAHPEGYRKARRLMKLAEKLRLPVLTFVDTSGAHPDMAAEERGQALAIATNLQVMAGLETPILVTIIGEGGSGGALGIALGDRVLMQEYAIYSVISPEGCASILWRSKNLPEIEEAARALKLTAPELLQLGVIDEVVPEPSGGAHREPQKAAELLAKVLRKHLTELRTIKAEQLVEIRYQKYKKMGVFREIAATPEET
ncbi:MAG: acetyl-CoA carboxylase carboxyltransferase subunit alpha [Candidatus Omnitrophica bacterium]|nr:acetyl-CoA carboxylase carboxyltransferase subunit alpha [Candidatus Omnitrophota bacterium]